MVNVPHQLSSQLVKFKTSLDNTSKNQIAINSPAYLFSIMVTLLYLPVLLKTLNLIIPFSVTGVEYILLLLVGSSPFVVYLMTRPGNSTLANTFPSFTTAPAKGIR